MIFLPPCSPNKAIVYSSIRFNQMEVHENTAGVRAQLYIACRGREGVERMDVCGTWTVTKTLTVSIDHSTVRSLWLCSEPSVQNIQWNHSRFLLESCLLHVVFEPCALWCVSFALKLCSKGVGRPFQVVCEHPLTIPHLCELIFFVVVMPWMKPVLCIYTLYIAQWNAILSHCPY